MKHILCAALFLLATTATAQDAIRIDDSGAVDIPGALSTGALSTGALTSGPIDGTAITATTIDGQTINGTTIIADTITANTVQAPNLEAKIDQLLEGMQWEVFATNLYEAMVKVEADWVNLTTNYEFMMNRNAGQRRLHFSSWNKGMRVTTDSYMTGDKAPFTMGGSMWTRNVVENCPSGQVYHRYYYFRDGGVTATSGNRCRAETTVYARKRLFK